MCFERSVTKIIFYKLIKMSIVNYYFRRFIRIVLDFIAFIIGLRFTKQTSYLPPITNRLLLEPASQLTKKIKSGQVINYFLQKPNILHDEDKWFYLKR